MKIKADSHSKSPRYPLLAAAVAVAAVGGGAVALRAQTVWTEEQLEKAQEMFRTAGVPLYDVLESGQPAEVFSSPSSTEQRLIPDRPVDTPER